MYVLVSQRPRLLTVGGAQWQSCDLVQINYKVDTIGLLGFSSLECLIFGLSRLSRALVHLLVCRSSSLCS